jgi:hypothetical protein
MSPILQWSIPIIVGILTFFAGRSFERNKLAQANRLQLLLPIEEWVKYASRLVEIIGDDMSAVVSGFQFPVGYSPDERSSTSKYLGENKEKVVGILSSEVFKTRLTQKISVKLNSLITALSDTIEQGYLKADIRLLEKMNQNEDPTTEMEYLISSSMILKKNIQEIHSCISQLKVRFN